MKTCARCHKEKDESQFFKKTGKRLHSYCKPCFSRYCMDRWLARKRWAIELLGGKCADCGNTFHQNVYEFHHNDPTEKELDWNKLRQCGIAKIKLELAKCTMLCANCHRHKHALSS